MTENTLVLNNVFSVLTVANNVFLLVIIVSLFRRSAIWSKKFLSLLKQHSYNMAFLLSLGSIIGSLIYSEVIGFDPCSLCWIQRVFLFSIALFLCIALFKRERVINDYILSLSILGGLIALYHSMTQLGAPSLTKCTEIGGDCSVVYFVNFGYITIPFMAFSVFALIAVLIFIPASE